MVRFFTGLIVGALLGVGGTYYVLEREVDEPAVAEVADAGVAEVAPKKSRRKHRRRAKDKRAKAVDEVVGDEPLIDDAPAPTLSAADHELVWRGAAVALGSREVDLDGADARALSQGEIERVVGPATDRFVACILEARGAAAVRAPVKVKFRVDGRGQVGPVRVQAARYLHDHGLGGCVKGVAGRLRFPATGAPTIVELPFSAQ